MTEVGPPRAGRRGPTITDAGFAAAVDALPFSQGQFRSPGRLSIAGISYFMHVNTPRQTRGQRCRPLACIRGVVDRRVQSAEGLRCLVNQFMHQVRFPDVGRDHKGCRGRHRFRWRARRARSRFAQARRRLRNGTTPKAVAAPIPRLACHDHDAVIKLPFHDHRCLIFSRVIRGRLAGIASDAARRSAVSGSASRPPAQVAVARLGPPPRPGCWHHPESR
jgi:hypothetical protein